MLKIIAPFRFRTDKPYDECVTYWLEVHKLVVEKNMPECRRYVQNLTVPVRSQEWPFDAVAEIWFDDMGAIRRTFEGPLAEIVREDEMVFSPGGDKSQWAIVNEYPIFER